MTLESEIKSKRASHIPLIQQQLTKLNLALNKTSKTDAQDFEDVKNALVAFINLLVELEELMKTIAINFSLQDRNYVSDLPDSHVRLLDSLKKDHIKLTRFIKDTDIQEILIDG